MFRTPRPQYTIVIQSPCHENWQEMTEVERGRYCRACQTVVTDFTGLSDDEIIRHLENSAGGKMCGRFLNTQTQRPLLPEIKVHRISVFRKVAASALLFYATVSEAMAQTPKAKSDIHTSYNTQKPSAKITGITISGKVTDFTGQGLPNLELQIAGTDSIKTTDAYGRFKFRLPEIFTNEEVTIHATQKGQLLLDSTGSFINDTKITIDTFPFKKAVVIYRYPVEVLNEVPEIMAVKRGKSYVQGLIEEVHDCPKAELTPAVAGPNTIKKTPWQKFKDFFKGKQAK